MIKYLITSKCNRKCDYCITKNIKQDEVTNFADVLNKLAKVRHDTGETDIMITGGEPTMSSCFMDKVDMANLVFRDVFLTTQNLSILKKNEENPFSPILSIVKAVTFSLHGRKPYSELGVIGLKGIPVYASILDNEFFQDLPQRLKALGYAGLTINEEQRDGHYFNDSIVEELPNFSVKINRRGHCLKDMTMILPDLTVIKNFEEYL